MNCLMISGTLTCDPKSRMSNVLGVEVQVCDLSVAVPTDKDVVHFKVNAYREKADICLKMLKKGDKITVVGPVKQNMFVNENNRICGNMEVLAEHIEFDKLETEFEKAPVAYESEEIF